MSDRTQSAHAQQTHKRDEVKVIATTYDAQAEKYMSLLPGTVDKDAFRNAFLTAVQRRPALLDADRNSLWLSLQNAAADGLMPDNREAALVIFNEDDEDDEGKRVSRGNRPKQVVYMPMIRGLRKLCRNTGTVSSIDATLVYKGEHIRIWREDGEKHFEHTVNTEPDFNDSPANIIGAYAIVRYKDGTWEGEWMSRAKIERVKAISRAKKGPWLPWYDEMARKTVLRRLLKQLDASPELRNLEQALARDPTLDNETIDGESEEIAERIAAPPQEQPRRRHVEVPDREEPNPPRQESAPGAPQSQDTQSPPKPEKPAADKPAPGDDGFAGYLVDPDGVEVPDGPIQGAMAFARAFVALCQQHPKAVDDLLEINGAAIEDACDTDPEVRAVIEAVRLPDEKRDGPDDPAPVHEQDIPVAVPVTPKNAPHWPNYAAACEVALQALTTRAEIDHWIAVNEYTYGQRAIKGKIVSLIRARLTELGLGETQETGREPVEDAIARLPKMDAGDFQRLHASAVHRTWVNDLFPPDRERYLAAEAARIAELRVPA